jgi:hypothetical protein
MGATTVCRTLAPANNLPTGSAMRTGSRSHKLWRGTAEERPNRAHQRQPVRSLLNELPHVRFPNNPPTTETVGLGDMAEDWSPIYLKKTQ